MPAADHILTFDLGTTACKTSLFTLDGRVASQVGIEYPTLQPAPGTAERDPGAWWAAASAAARKG